MSYDYQHKAIWFRTYKVASRTIDNHLKEGAKDGQYIYGSAMPYRRSSFKNFFKFAFIRNPETRFVSAWKDKVLKQNYFMFNEKEHEKMKDLNNFLSWVETQDVTNCDEHLKSLQALIDINNIDFIGRFENFNEDFDYLSQRLKLKVETPEHLNKGIAKSDFELSPEQRKRIYNIYRRDFEIFYPAEAAELRKLS